MPTWEVQTTAHRPGAIDKIPHSEWKTVLSTTDDREAYKRALAERDLTHLDKSQFPAGAAPIVRIVRYGAIDGTCITTVDDLGYRRQMTVRVPNPCVEWVSQRTGYHQKNKKRKAA